MTRDMTHCHPLGLNAGNGDNSVAKDIYQAQKRNGYQVPTFNIYHIPTKSYIPFYTEKK